MAFCCGTKATKSYPVKCEQGQRHSKKISRGRHKSTKPHLSNRFHAGESFKIPFLLIWCGNLSWPYDHALRAAVTATACGKMEGKCRICFKRIQKNAKAELRTQFKHTIFSFSPSVSLLGLSIFVSAFFLSDISSRTMYACAE